jgi:hypothetical protein
MSHLRNPRRQYLAAYLHSCGPRPVLEALIAVEKGQPVEDVLKDFSRLPPSIFEALGADTMPIDELAVIEGGW